MVEPSAVGVLSRPALSAADAQEIAAERWGVRGAASPLPSERDQNFLIEGEDGRYVLKVANRAEDGAVLDMQNRAMERLRRARIPCPDPVRDRTGDDVAVVGGHLVRMVRHVEGRPMAEFHPRPPNLLRDLGRTMGAVDRALEGFDHPAASRELYWDVRHAERVIDDRLGAVTPTARRKLVRRTVERHVSMVRPELAPLRTGVIHNDANDHNVLVDDAAQRVAGLLDFGDMVRTYVVNEVAVAATYAMLGESEPLDAARSVVEGYLEASPLEHRELGVLLDLIRIRLATSVTVAAHQHSLRPDDPYLTVSEHHAWALLELLEGIDPDAARSSFPNRS